MKRICNLLIVVLTLSLAVGTVGCTAKFEMSSLEVSPEVCLPGDTVKVSATLANTGNAQGDYVAEFLVNGTVEQTQTFTLEPGSSQSHSFTLVKGKPGRYVVQLGELTAPFTILGVRNLKISPSEVEVDQLVTVTADLQNVAETQATYHSRLLFQGKEVEAKDITVAGGSTEKVTFMFFLTTPGMHKVGLLGLSGFLKVLKPAEFKLVNLDIAPNPVKVGGQATITISIENAGEAEGTYTANLVVDGQVEQTSDVTLASGTTKSVPLVTSKDSPGSYNIEIGGQEAILKVVQPVRLETGTFLVRELSGGKAKLKIENERDLDAVVVLSSLEEPTIPLLAFYVRAGDSYRAGGIRGGIYVIQYALGRDWIEDSQKFLTEATYQRFSDEFRFTSRSGHYTIWTIFLGGGGGEPAGTQRVGEGEFPKLG